MALKNIVNGNTAGNTIDQAWWNQFLEILTGQMTDTPITLACVVAGATTVTVNASATNSATFSATTGADSQGWFILQPNYRIALGPGGNTAPDVSIYRSAAAELTLVGNVKITGTLSTQSQGAISFNQIAITGKNTDGAVQFPWQASNSNDCKIIWLDGQSGTPGQVSLGSRQGGLVGQKDVILYNDTTGWAIVRSQGGQFHIQDPLNSPGVDPLVVDSSGVTTFGNTIINSSGYGLGGMKFIGSYGGGKATIAHGLGYTPPFCYAVAWFNNINATGTYASAVSSTDSSNVTVNISGTTNSNVYAC